MDVKTLCLGVLFFGDATGYEIRKACSEGMISHLYEAGYGSIYPALAQLSGTGLVTCTEMAQDGRPDKKVYSLTEAGRQALIESLREPPAHDRIRSEFMFGLLFSQLLPNAEVGKRIDERIAWYRDGLERMRTCLGHDMAPGAQFVTGYGIAVYEAAANYLETHRDTLIRTLSQSEDTVEEQPAREAVGR
ncbi:MAG: PadR family transcriptional regulator [Rhodospirillaceae bacterium]|nr:PadR family transcriptional regulator [Rhodospirillaceae bacterium]